jgi:hypothetical protein
MVMTTWDGHLRIDHVADADAVTLTLLTIEPTTEIRLRTGLIIGFVTNDPHGPPAFIAVTLDDGRLPPDVEALLGTRVVQAVHAAERWLRLDLTQVRDLAAAWAPYRGVTLASVQQGTANRGALGTWAEELWTCLGLLDWRDLLRVVPAVQVRGIEQPADEDRLRGTWRLPSELADAVGVAPDVEWRLVPGDQDAVEIELRVRPTGQSATAVLQAGLDDGSQRWTSFETHSLRLRLPDSDEPASVRFRSESRSS